MTEQPRLVTERYQPARQTPEQFEDISFNEDEKIASQLADITIYPVDALGDVLAAAAKAIAAKVQCPVELAAQSVLGAASLAAQGQADVMLPMGQSRPISLFLVSILDSSDRKSTADNEAMIPVRMREKKLGELHKVELEIYEVTRRAWQAQYKQIERSKLSFPERERQVKELGPEPAAPMAPFLTFDETTIEGLLKLMPELPGALGVCSPEAAAFLAGHGFSDDAKKRTAAGFCNLWDGKEVRSGRVSGMRGVKGRRLSASLMIQPDAAREVLSDPILRNQGFLSRILVAAPQSLAGGRMWREPAEGIEPALRRYAKRILDVFEAPQICGDKLNELTPRVLALSAEARGVWIALHDEVEVQLGAGKRLAELKDFGGKLAENALRLAGVLAIVDDPYAKEIDVDAMTRGCKLARWYLGEAVRLAEAYRVPQEVADGEKVLQWCRDRGLREVTATALLQGGPGSLRSKERLDPAIVILEEIGGFVRSDKSSGRVRVWTVKQEK